LKGTAVYVLEDQIARRRVGDGVRARLGNVVDLADVWMIQRRDGARFRFESTDAVPITGERFGQYLDRHVSTKTRVMRPVDLAHSAGSERRVYDIGPEAGARRQRHVDVILVNLQPASDQPASQRQI
jgi:hypothetical protein